MQIAASMGAAAFQKGLGMVHSLAHPLSSMYDIHHGLANALMLPAAIEFIENAGLSEEQRRRISKVRALFAEVGLHSHCPQRMSERFYPNAGDRTWPQQTQGPGVRSGKAERRGVP